MFIVQLYNGPYEGWLISKSIFPIQLTTHSEGVDKVQGNWYPADQIIHQSDMDAFLIKKGILSYEATRAHESDKSGPVAEES